MSTPRTRRPSKGRRTAATGFFSDRERLFDELNVAAWTTGRRGPTVALAIDHILDHARLQMARAQRRRFDRERHAIVAEIAASLPTDQQRAYDLERQLMRLMGGRTATADSEGDLT